MASFEIELDLRKRQEKTILKITEGDLANSQEKILSTMKKECVDLQSWLYIMLYYYDKKDYNSFKKFSEEFSKLTISQNPYYKEQKEQYIYILNILSFFYSFISEESQDKENYDNYSTNSTMLINQAEKISVYNTMSMVCKGFVYFTQGEYESSNMYFSNICDNTKDVPKNIVILAKLGRGLNSYNQGNYSRAIEFFTNLIREEDYCNENILQMLGICYYYNKKVKKAKEIFEQILAFYPNNYKVKTYLNVINLGDIENENFDENFDKSFAELIEAYQQNDYNDFSIPLLLIKLVDLLLLAKKYSEAEILCQKLNSQLKQGEFKYKTSNEATKTEKTKKDYSDIKSAIYTINAKYLLCKGNTKEAFEFFFRSIELNNLNIEAQFCLGQLYLIKYSFSDAEKSFEICKKILDENKLTSFKVLKYLAYIKSKLHYKEIDSTIDMYKKAIATKNDDLDCYIELAELLNLRNPNESLVYYKKAVSLIKGGKADYSSTMYSDKILPEVLNNIACILIRLNKLEEVEELLKEAKNLIKDQLKEKENQKKKGYDVRLNALRMGIEFNLALFYEKLGWWNYTSVICKEIKRANPNFVEAYIKLSELARKRGNIIKAKDYIQQAYEKCFIRKEEISKKVKTRENEKKEKTGNETKETKEHPKEEQIDTTKEKENKQQAEDKDKGEKSEKSKENKENKKVFRDIELCQPVNPLLIQASLLYEDGHEQEAIIRLIQILKHYDDKDPYTLIFLGNIYYSLAIENRGKGIDVEKMNRAVEYYYHALELDKYNSMAAIGICNCLSEYNYVDKALEIYKGITESMEDNHNAFINECFLFMNAKKFEKASVVLNKVSKKLFNGNNQNIENLLAKCYIETKNFSKANRILKNLMLKYPDNITYKFNYGVLLRTKSIEILSKTERKVSETKEAITSIKKALGLFESIYRMAHEGKEIVKLHGFLYSCSEAISVCRTNLNLAEEKLKQDKENEEKNNARTKNSMAQYYKMIEEEEEKNKKINEEENEENEEKYEEDRKKAEELLNMYVEEEKEKAKKKMPKKKISKDKFIDEQEQEEENDDSDDKEKKRNKKKHKHKKHREEKHHHHHHHRHHSHKRKRSESSDDEDLKDEAENLSQEEDKNENVEERNDSDSIEIKRKKNRKLRKIRNEEDRFDDEIGDKEEEVPEIVIEEDNRSVKEEEKEKENENAEKEEENKPSKKEKVIDDDNQSDVSMKDAEEKNHETENNKTEEKKNEAEEKNKEQPENEQPKEN